MGDIDLKKYFEELAKMILVSFVDSKYERLVLKDKPDLQSKDLECGIEVCRCIDTYDGRAEDFFRNYNNKNNSDSFLQNKAKQMNLTPWIDRNCKTNSLVFCPHDKLQDLNHYKELILQYIIKKDNKFNEYDKFKTNGLFLYCYWPFKREDIEEIIKKIPSNNFDIIFFECKNCLYCFKKKKNEIDIYEYQHDEYKEMLDFLNNKYNIK